MRMVQPQSKISGELQAAREQHLQSEATAASEKRLSGKKKKSADDDQTRRQVSDPSCAAHEWLDWQQTTINPSSEHPSLTMLTLSTLGILPLILF